jgi:HlyD family secretion protein
VKQPRKSPARQSINRHLRIGIAAAGMLVIGFGGWATTTELSGAVLATGNVVVDANVKKVQHPIGGVVGAIHVRNGDHVEQGDVVLRLDPTVARANLAVITKSLDALAIRQGRLEAERDGREAIELPADLTRRLSEAELSSLMRTELGFFHSRRNARAGLRAQLGERVVQFNEQISGLTLQAEALADSLELVREELTGIESLYAKKLVSIGRLMELKREEAGIRGSHAQTIAEIAQTKGRISEVELQAMQVDQDMRTEVTGELREIQERTAELSERKIAALDELERIDIRAPHDGVVHELTAHTIGGVVEAGAALMLIVPETDELSIEVRVAAQDRDQIHVGQPAMLRMTAFNQRTTPELKGEVSVVAADLVEDARTGMQYFPLRIALLAGERERLSEKKLTPGMPVESFVQTGYRTVFSYLTKPLADYVVRAFRSD